jgi:hypothetical protein
MLQPEDGGCIFGAVGGGRSAFQNAALTPKAKVVDVVDPQAANQISAAPVTHTAPE